ncbi:MAG: hypothetical protein A2Y15_03205 [Clostridiales bacterium GWF2_36_10]|nr:MAG: hypothetical protein A2Y15_03205 [Clostridiales bacterium GWF2_36_10]HAN20981.1 hypothetical protein [Clostridiales bacterium]
MDKISKKVLAIAAQALTVFLGVYGILFANITSFNIKLNEVTVLIYCAVAAICFSIVFFAEKYKKTLYLSTMGISLIIFFINNERILNGFKFFLNILTSLISRFSSSIDATETVKLSRNGIIIANTAFFAFLGVLLIFLIAFTLIKLNPLWPTLFITIPIFALCMIFIKRVPDTTPVFAFLVFLTSINITNLVRQGDNKRGAKMTLFFIPIMLVFLLMISLVFSSKNYVRADFAAKIYSFFSERLPLSVTNPSRSEVSEDGSEEFSNSSRDESQVSEDSETETSEPVNRTDDFLDVDLRNADPNNRTGKVILQVKTDKTGEMLLRGYSLGYYTKSKWVKFNGDALSKLNLLTSVGSINENETAETIISPLSLATYVALTSDRYKKNYINITEMIKGGEVVYTPYYPSFSDFKSLNYNNDSVILYNDNYAYSKNVNAIYNIKIFNCDNIKAENTTNKYRDSEEYAKVKELESQYRDVVYQYYTQIDSATSNFLLEYTSDQNFHNISDREQLVDEVKNFVKNCAEYNLKAPKTPSGRDYVQYFLTDSKQGYCMHFATTATLIFRSFGVPARYVTGYAASIKGSEANTQVDVTDKNAHAWVEVYFDGIGWIPVDVTPGSVEERVNDPAYNDNSGSNSHEPNISEPVISSESNESEVTVESSLESEPVSSDKSSDLSFEQSDVSIEPFFSKYKNELLWITPVSVIFITVLILLIRRKSMQSKRKNHFGLSETNRIAVFTWKYIEKLKPYGVEADKNVYGIAQKAVFSKHILSDDELETIVSFAAEKGKEVDKKLGFFKRFVFRYIKGMY